MALSYPPATSKIVPLLFFYKDESGIKQSMLADMSFNKEIKT